MTEQVELQSTDVGFVNDNGLEVTAKTNRPGTHPNQMTYILYHLHGDGACGKRTLANGCDIWEKRCSHCQEGE